jgi:hypothetical protein
MDAYRSVTAYAETISIGIARGHVARIQDGGGVLLRVQYGAVWITQTGSTEDVCLDAGGWFRIDRDGRTLVSPGGSAPMALVTLAPSIRTTQSLGQRVASAFGNLWAGLHPVPPRTSTSWI